MSPPAVSFLNWVLKYKGDCPDPMSSDDLYNAYPTHTVRKSVLKQRVTFKFKKEQLEEYGLNDRAKLLHIFCQSMSETLEKLLRDDGATLQLTDDRLIAYFRSADGTVERGVALPQAVEDEPVQNGNVPAAVGAPNLVEPKEEVVEHPDPEAAEPPVVKMEAAELVAQNLEPVLAQGRVEPKQEAADQTPAPSQNQSRKRKTAGLSSNNLEAVETDAPKIKKVAEQEPTELTINATSILKSLCNLSSSFHWSNEFGTTARNEIPGRSGQKILRTKIQKVIESSHEALMDGASINILASKDSIQFVDFLRVYRTWLLMTEYNDMEDIDEKMGQEIKDYDQMEDGAPVKRIRINKLLLILGQWLNVATPGY